MAYPKRFLIQITVSKCPHNLQLRHGEVEGGGLDNSGSGDETGLRDGARQADPEPLSRQQGPLRRDQDPQGRGVRRGPEGALQGWMLFSFASGVHVVSLAIGLG